MAATDDRYGRLRDPRASLRICGATAHFPDPVGDVDVPAADAADWLDVLMVSPDLLRVLEILAAEDRSRIRAAMIHGRVTLATVREVLGDALTVVSGRPWWETIMIVSTTVASWDESMGGTLATKGIRAQGMPLGSWVDAAWTTMRELTGGEDKLASLVSTVRTRPREPGEEEGMEAAEFDAAMAAWS